MMTSAVVNLMKIKGKSIIASNRIAKFLSDELGLPLVDEAKLCKTFDRVIIVNGPMLYCSFREELKTMVETAKEVIWVQNDYAIKPPGFIKDKDPIYWSSCDQMKGQNYHLYTNWNQLTFLSETKPYEGQKMKGLCYYGAFRKGRAQYFEKYFRKAPYRIHLSSSKTGRLAFHKIAPNANYFNSNDIIDAIRSAEACLYAEDKATHKLYASPANRFYEALSAHTLQLFDVSTKGTFERAGIDVRPWIVDGQNDVARFLEDAESHRIKQMAQLRKIDYRQLLVAETAEAYKKIELKNRTVIRRSAS